ncbi:MAG: hypothetical protein PHG00_15130 [Methylococcales bacterium]|nr:hypothetical protein [Methylococcales bacterium]
MRFFNLPHKRQVESRRKPQRVTLFAHAGLLSASMCAKNPLVLGISAVVTISKSSFFLGILRRSIAEEQARDFIFQPLNKLLISM